MRTHPFTRRPRWLGPALFASFLLAASFVCGQSAGPAKTGGEPPLPSKKSADEDPPLPTKKAAAKQVRVQVTAASAEVQSGDKVIATVTRGQVLPFTRKNADYYLVTVDGKKGWIRREDVREIEVAGGPGTPAVEVPPGPAPTVIAAETTRKVKRATTMLRVRLASGNTVEGSGFFAAAPGLVLTNAHVLGMLSPSSHKPAEVRVVVHSGEREEFTLTGEVLGVDREHDLGVVRVKGEAGRLPAPLTVGNSESLALVQKVYIFGFPFGTELGKDITVSESSVTSIRKDSTGRAVKIQVNGGMNPGNSGGPVVDSRGVVVGVAVSIIQGTQLNFAVPGERVQALLRGRVARAEFGEPFLDEGKPKLPVRLDCLDPLGRFRTVKLVVWAGKPSAARPPSPTKPKPLPGDGPRETVKVTYQGGTADADVPMPPLGEGQVLWVQPAVTDADGATHYAAAFAYQPSGLPPLERKAAVLQYQPDRQAQRTIKLSGAFKVQLTKGPVQLVLRDAMEVQALEVAAKEPRGGRVGVFLGAFKFTTTDPNGRTAPLFPRAQAMLRGRSLTFITSPQGALVERSVPVLNAPHPFDLREDFRDLVQQIANPYEMTSLPVPNREVRPKETWTARLPMLLMSQGKPQAVDVFLTCTYEGRRSHGGQDHAVILLSGHVKDRKPGRQTVGFVSGKADFAIEDGYLALAKVKVESEATDGNLTVAHSVDVALTRVRGNTAGIVAQPAPGGPVARGKVVFRSVMNLLATDPGNCPARPPGCHYKVRPVQLEAGKTYIVEMDKVGQSNLDPYLVLVNPRGQVVAQDDDGGGFPNARIVFRAPEAGMFRIFATSFQPGMTGMFRLTVSEEAGAAGAGATVGGDYALAVPFLQKRDFDSAIPLLEKAVRANPTLANAYRDLGFAYTEKRLYDLAIPCLKKAIELTPGDAASHNNLGVAYSRKGLYDQAIPVLRKAIQLDPNYSAAHGNLGIAFNERGQYEQAVACLKKAVELQPKNLGARDNLALIQVEAGDLAGARDNFKALLSMLPMQAPAWKAVKGRLEQVEAFVALEPRLEAIARGEWKPSSFRQGVQFGHLCRLKQHYQAALRIYEQALSEDADAAKKLPPNTLLTLARTAVLASAGKGIAPPPEAERPKYRAKALGWLRGFVKAQQEALDKDQRANHLACGRSLRGLLQHEHLAPVRAPALDSLPPDERPEWGRLWGDVNTLLTRADTAAEASLTGGKR